MKNAVLRVLISQARNLVAKDRNGKSDPFVVVKLGQQQSHKTAVVHKTLNPVWSSEFDFVITPVMPEGSFILDICMWDKDLIGKDFMGHVKIPLADVLHSTCPLFHDPNNTTNWYPLLGRTLKDKISGEISIKLGFLNEVDPELMEILESVASQVHLQSQVLTTDDLADDVYFNNFTDEEAAAQMNFSNLQLSDLNRATSDQRISLGDRTGSAPGQVPPEDSVKEGRDLDDPSLDHSQMYGLLVLDVVSASNLPFEKNLIKTSFDCDPFVVISFGKKTFRTRVVRHTLNPVWKERLFVQKMEYTKDYTVAFSIYDYDAVSNNDHIGTIEVTVQELIKASAPIQRVSNEPVVIKDVPLNIKFKPVRAKASVLYKFNSLASTESTLSINVAFIPYVDIRRNFWLTLAKTYDTDNDSRINQVELITLLDSVGSTFSDEHIERLMEQGLKDEDGLYYLTFEQLFEVLEQQLFDILNSSTKNMSAESKSRISSMAESLDNVQTPLTASQSAGPTIPTTEHANGSARISDVIEHIIQIAECPICNKNLARKNDLDAVSHVALCAYSDLSQLDRFGGLLTRQYASRKWYTKILSYVTYGGYGIGKNNANILVQNRAVCLQLQIKYKTGQLTEEKMPAYIRLGIRMLYHMKGSRSGAKQGKKFDDPSSTKEIPSFIAFHKLPLDEVLEPLENFKNFNEFFYRKLKPGFRKLDSPDDPSVAVSPADCRLSVFPTIHQATTLWIKGSSFSVASLLGDKDKAALFENGALAICRLAPQDYHRFHIPVDGRIGPTTSIEGQYYTVNPMAVRTAIDVYTENIRKVTYIESPQFGTVAYVSIGAMMVGSILLTTTENQQVKRMDEQGQVSYRYTDDRYFAFGGSTIILLFRPNKIVFDNDLVENSSQCVETLVKVGNSIGREYSVAVEKNLLGSMEMLGSTEQLQSPN